MDLDMKENFKMIILMVKEFTLGQQVIDIMEIGFLVKNKEKEIIFMLMDEFMKEIFIMIYFRVLENSLI